MHKPNATCNSKFCSHNLLQAIFFLSRKYQLSLHRQLMDCHSSNNRKTHTYSENMWAQYHYYLPTTTLAVSSADDMGRLAVADHKKLECSSANPLLFDFICSNVSLYSTLMYSYQVASTVASDGYHVWYQGALDSMETYQRPIVRFV